MKFLLFVPPFDFVSLLLQHRVPNQPWNLQVLLQLQWGYLLWTPLLSHDLQPGVSFSLISFMKILYIYKFISTNKSNIMTTVTVIILSCCKSSPETLKSSGLAATPVALSFMNTTVALWSPTRVSCSLILSRFGWLGSSFSRCSTSSAVCLAEGTRRVLIEDWNTHHFC